MAAITRSNPLSYLTNQLDDLKAKGTHFRLRVLEDEQEVRFQEGDSSEVTAEMGSLPARPFSSCNFRAMSEPARFEPRGVR